MAFYTHSGCRSFFFLGRWAAGVFGKMLRALLVEAEAAPRKLWAIEVESWQDFSVLKPKFVRERIYCVDVSICTFPPFIYITHF